MLLFLINPTVRKILKGRINISKKRFLFNSISLQRKRCFRRPFVYLEVSVLQRKLKNLLKLYKDLIKARFVETFIQSMAVNPFVLGVTVHLMDMSC